MNEFEAYNLRQLAQRLDEAKVITNEIRREILAMEIEHWVYMLFEFHEGDLSKIKEEIRKESELIKKLGFADFVNQEYKRHLAKKDIYDPDEHRQFWAAIYELAQIHNQQFTT